MEYFIYEFKVVKDIIQGLVVVIELDMQYIWL